MSTTLQQRKTAKSKKVDTDSNNNSNEGTKQQGSPVKKEDANQQQQQQQLPQPQTEQNAKGKSSSNNNNTTDAPVKKPSKRPAPYKQTTRGRNIASELDALEKLQKYLKDRIERITEKLKSSEKLSANSQSTAEEKENYRKALNAKLEEFQKELEASKLQMRKLRYENLKNMLMSLVLFAILFLVLQYFQVFQLDFSSEFVTQILTERNAN